AVGDQLDLYIVISVFGSKIIWNDNGHFYSSFCKMIVYFIIIFEIGNQPEMPRSAHMTDQFPAEMILRLIQHRHRCVFKFICNGKPKNDHLHNGHPKEYEQGSPVSQDVEIFLFYKCQKGSKSH